MPVFSAKSFRNHEQVLFHQDPDSSLVAIIAIHDTTLGPALGGCGYWSYNIEDAALGDVLRLSRGMTYKAALVGLSFGGNKAVILAPNCGEKAPHCSRPLAVLFTAWPAATSLRRMSARRPPIWRSFTALRRMW